MKKTLLILFALLMSTGFSFAQKELAFEDGGKIKLSEFDGYADDAVVTINIIVTNEGGWGPGWGVGRVIDYAFAKDNTKFAVGITVKASSAEGTINSYQYTVAELKAIASILPDDLDELKEASAKTYGEDWAVNDDNYIVDAWNNIGIAVSVWGTGTLAGISIKEAPPVFVLDFESDEVGKEYPTISINENASPEDVTAVVENRPGGEGKALHVINGKWNTYPQILVAFPKDKTLADIESISFELYFESVEPAGGQTPNSYKEFRYFFGEEGTIFTEAGKGTGNLVGSPSDNPGKTWLKKDFVPVIDETLPSLNKFEFGLGLHINNAGNYFLDNITFVLKETGGCEEPQPVGNDFESDEIDATYPMMCSWGWPESKGSATVVSDPLGISKNSIKIVPGNWSNVIYFPVTLPDGYSVADITEIQFDSYYADADAEIYNGVELFMAPKDAKPGNGTYFNTYPVSVESKYIKVSEPGEWYTISITREQIINDANFTNAGSNGGGKSDFGAIDDVSEFLFGVGLASVDFGEYYLDNITFVLSDGSGIVQVKPAISQVYSTIGGIIVNAVNERVSIYGIDGRLVKQTVANSNFIALSRGLYIVKVGADKAVKVPVK